MSMGVAFASAFFGELNNKKERRQRRKETLQSGLKSVRQGMT